MDRQLQQRVVGAAVLVAAGVIFIPLFLDDGSLPPPVPGAVDVPAPPEEGDFASQIVPIDAARLEELESRAERPIEIPNAVVEETAAEMIEHANVSGTTETAPDDNAAAPETAPEGTPEPVAKPVAETSNSAPDPPQVVETEADGRTGVVAWTVQLGSFANDENAKRLIEKLRDADFPAYLERRVEADTTVFKVRVGPEIRREDAEKLRDKLEQQFALKGMLLRYQ